MANSTLLLLFGLSVTFFARPSDDAIDVFWYSAVGVGVSLVGATALQGAAGVRNLLRVDILMLWILYGLTFLEFLFPQSRNEFFLSSVAATAGVNAVLLGFAGIAIGRHLIPVKRGGRGVPSFSDIRPNVLFVLFVMASVVGYFHVFIAVNFDPLEVLRQMAMPRFAQAWTRGQFGGDAFSLLVEIGALTYLLPAIGGLVMARPDRHGFGQKIIVLIVLTFTLYYGFSSGTRNILAIYVILFLGSYFLNKRNLTLWKLISVGAPALVVLVIASAFMLEFRGVGLSNFSFTDGQPRTLHIDRNLVVISQVTELFPASYDYLGLEVPFNALIRPIPRMLWPGKPENLSVSMESATAAQGWTIASTFVGEAYMSGGLIGVLIASLFFGVAAESWNRLGLKEVSNFGQILYASGFLCASISMRSLLWIGPTMLPTIALWLFGKCFLRSTSASVHGQTRPPDE